jgi:hypothetical protein
MEFCDEGILGAGACAETLDWFAGSPQRYVLANTTQATHVLSYVAEHADAFNILYVHHDLNEVKASLNDGSPSFRHPLEYYHCSFMNFARIERVRVLSDSEATKRTIDLLFGR